MSSHSLKISATVGYYDGRLSTRHQLQLILDGNTIVIRGDGIDRSYLATTVTVPPGIGSVRRTLRLPDGGLCEIEDGALLAALENACNSAPVEKLVHRWEKSLPLSFSAVAVTILVVWLFLRFGVPAMAKHLALALPPATEATIGKETLSTLDRLIMKPSTLDKTRRDELSALFRRVAGNEPAAMGYRLEFRAIPSAGANAFALPAGIVIITDDLVALAKDDDEIAAIMAHELGHVRSRHIMRHLLQSSASGLIVATLTGDMVSITSLAATLPTMLMNASYSRGFEQEADDAAIDWMKRADIPPRRYGEILARLQAQLDVRHGITPEGGNPARNYLSTHPDTGARIRRILKAGGE